MTLLLKALFDHNLTMLIYKTDSNMLKYELLFTSNKNNTGFDRFHITKDLPDYYLEIPENARIEEKSQNDNGYQKYNTKTEFKLFWQTLLQNNLQYAYGTNEVIILQNITAF